MFARWKLYRRLHRDPAPGPGWGETPRIEEDPPAPALSIAPEGATWYRLYMTDGERRRYVDGYPHIRLAWEALGNTHCEQDAEGVWWHPIVRIEFEETP